MADPSCWLVMIVLHLVSFLYKQKRLSFLICTQTLNLRCIDIQGNNNQVCVEESHLKFKIDLKYGLAPVIGKNYSFVTTLFHS